MTENEDLSLDEWLTMDAALDRALDLEGEARNHFLASLSSDLRAGVGALLGAASEPGLLDNGIHGVAGRLLEDAESRLDPMVEGRRIGAYRLIERIGAGGMGVVYLAERADGEFEHLVALKIVRWELAEPGLIARFMTERRILAQLGHPHIATLFDGGMTPEGLRTSFWNGWRVGLSTSSASIEDSISLLGSPSSKPCAELSTSPTAGLSCTVISNRPTFWSATTGSPNWWISGSPSCSRMRRSTAQSTPMPGWLH